MLNVIGGTSYGWGIVLDGSHNTHKTQGSWDMARLILGCTIQLGNKSQKTGRQDEFRGRRLHPGESGKQQRISEYHVWGQLTVCRGWSAKRSTLSTTLSKLLVKHKPKSQGNRKSISARKILTV